MTRPSPGRPQPVLSAAQTAAIATWATALLVGWLARRGVLLPAEISELAAHLIGLGIVAVVGAGSSLLGALRARRHVTPLADPRDDDGVRLVPARQLPPVPPARWFSRPEPPSAPDTALIERTQVAGPFVDVRKLRAEYGLD
ncbi:hypothetical protein [Blastococcus sp. TF02A-26]|uniref:hypothetical protein n=1 Tax=Blastococcus sp. TF02A-26 TaxID=2250577 RepID=UPI0011BE55A8|nr:hypothetical protein [Blastococcus sp. TF02A-26]